MSDRVLIAGGGVIGIACAHYLEQAGFSVTVIDRDRIAGACSHGNCGYICPSHVLPLTEPGMVGMGLKSLFKPNAPFRVKPRWDPALWRWMLRFARRCNERDMLAGARALKPILDASMNAYRELVQHPEIECEWNPNGLLYVFRGEPGFAHFAEMDELLTREFGVTAERLDGPALVEFEPALQDGMAGAFYYPGDATLRADELCRSWRAWLESRGVTFIEHCELQDVQREGAKIRAVKTSSGDLSADHFVFALGAWSSKLQREIGWALNVQPGKGYSLTLKRPARCPQRSVLLPETRVGITPMRDRYRLGSIMEFAGYDTSIPRKRLALLRSGSDPYLREAAGDEVIEEWYGWRPMTPDSLPIISGIPGRDNGWLATGHNMIGLTLAPATGRLLAELMSGGSPHIDPKPYQA